MDALDDYNYTPLHLVAKWGRLDFAQLLVSRGARIDIRNANGRTPEEHGRFMAEKGTDEEWMKGIRDVVQFLEEQRIAIPPKKIALPLYGKSLSKLLNISFEKRCEQLLSQLKADRGYRHETCVNLRSIEMQIHESPQNATAPFIEEMKKIIKQLKLNYPQDIKTHKLAQNFQELTSAKQIFEMYFQNPTQDFINELAYIFPIICPFTDILQELCKILDTKISDQQVIGICQFLIHFKGHENVTSADFPKPLCDQLSKHLEKYKQLDKEKVKIVIEFLKDPAPFFQRMHVDTDWKRKGIEERRTKLFKLLSIDFKKTSEIEREALISHLTQALMLKHKELFQLIRISDISFSMAKNTFYHNPLAEMERMAKDLTGNCLIYLMIEDSSKKRNLRFEFVLSWISKCLQYGDLHQAFALYEALAHPAILRISKNQIKLSEEYSKQWQHFKELFSPTALYQNYFTYMSQLLSPAIPSVSIYARLASANASHLTHYSILKNLQEHRLFAQSLILVTPEKVSDYQLFLTPSVYPEEANYNPDKSYKFIGEGFVWEKSRKILPPG